ncbi:MAG TPA: ATP-binding protein [Bacilli bacterium]|nr:ATP-binding protein [Bacilli bacterium]
MMADFYWLNAAISLSVFGYYLYRLGRGSFKGTRPVFRALTIVMLLLFFYTLYLAVRNSSPLGFVSTEVITSLNEPGAKWLFSGALITLGCIGLFFLGRRLEPVEDEMAMSVLHRRYRYMIEGDPRAILMFQHDRTLAEVNRQGSNWLSGTPEELRGLSVESVLDRLGFDEPEVVFERVLLKRSVEVKTEERILGDFEWSDLHCDKGNLLGSMLCFRDVTADKKFQREIIQSEKLAVVGQLAAATAHEIRNPLTSIKGFLQLLEHRMEREGQQGETREYTRIMVEEVDRMEKIIRDFLLMTKPSDVTREIGSLNAVLERVLVLIQNQAILRNIHVITELGDLPQVPMHKEAIQQVVLNLTQNALEAMNIGGTLTLHTFVEDSYIAIRVQDTGVGMTEEEVNNLGSPFYSTKTEGTGLGLTVSSKIIKEHGGEMQVESEKGKGTTITVRLPIA